MRDEIADLIMAPFDSLQPRAQVWNLWQNLECWFWSENGVAVTGNNNSSNNNNNSSIVLVVIIVVVDT